MTRRRDDRPHVLLILDPYGRWSLPKGHVEAGETRRQTAVREVEEETGLTGLRVGPRLGTVDWRFRREGVRVHKHCTYFLMRSDSGEARPAEEEGIRSCAWVPLDEAGGGVEYDTARDVVERARRVLRTEDPFS